MSAKQANVPWQINSNATLKIPKRIKDSKRIIQKNKFKKMNSSKTVMPDDNWQDKQNRFEFRENETVRVRGSDAIHKPSAYFIDISPAYDFWKSYNCTCKHDSWCFIKNRTRNYHTTWEFDPGSGWTLAACLTHASRTELWWNLVIRNLVADGWVTRG